MKKELLHKTISMLADFQVKGAKGLDFSVCYPQPEFNRRSIYWDLNYFKYNFLKTTEMDFQEDLLENDFDKLANTLLEDDNSTCMYRDFQSRHVRIVNGEPSVIDFQEDVMDPYITMWLFSVASQSQLSNELRDD